MNILPGKRYDSTLPLRFISYFFVKFTAVVYFSFQPKKKKMNDVWKDRERGREKIREIAIAIFIDIGS